MTLIDRRILIPAPVKVVWETVANHELLPKWRVDCRAVSLLSTRVHGSGVRRRISRLRGKDLIEEISVWYEGVGYEYRIVEGSPYKAFTSRIRLQATPDGTIVQWTIYFEAKGLFAWLWLRRRHHQRLKRMAEDGLRRLRRYVESTGATVDEMYREKAGVREGPSVDERLEVGAKVFAEQRAKQPPPATALSAEVPSSAGGPKIEEPPVKPEDTPSIPAVTPPSFLVEALGTAPPATEQPSSKSILEEPPVEQDDTRPNRPVSTTHSRSMPKITPEEALSEVSSLKQKEEEQKSAPSADSEVDEPTKKEAPIEEEPAKPGLPPQTSKMDTGEISIWDAFGMKPEEVVQEPAATTVKPDSIPEASGTPSSSTSDDGKQEEKTTSATPLDAWLAANEPPVPQGASATVSTWVRIPEKTRRMGFRKRLRRKRLKVREPRKAIQARRSARSNSS